MSTDNDEGNDLPSDDPGPTPSGNPPKTMADEVYCTSCGDPIKEQAVICPHCGVPQRTNPGSGTDTEQQAVNVALTGSGFEPRCFAAGRSRAWSFGSARPNLP